MPTKQTMGGVILGCLAMTTTVTVYGGERFSHADWTTVLERWVDERGRVDYLGLAANRAVLDRYLAAVAESSPRSAPQRFPSRDDALAFYLNAYNAEVFGGVLDRGPERKSVWRGLISGYDFFVRRKVVIGGESVSLKTLEDEWIRAGFADPRIHAALNCASIGCPRLPRAAFEADRLGEQLDAAMREFVDDDRHCRFDAERRVVELSKIFDWFADDFLAWERSQDNPSPSIVHFVNRYRAADSQLPADASVQYLPYGKGINQQ